jgi:competence protein ComFC
MSLIADLDRGLLDLIFPRDCMVTQLPMDDQARQYLSDFGARQLERIHDPRCHTCGHPFDGILEGDRTCPHCLDLNPAFGRAICAFRARGHIRQIIHEIKYTRCPFLIDDLVAAAVEDPLFRRHLAGAHLIPVPLHADKLSERSYNQAERITQSLCNHIPGCSWSHSLIKIKPTPSQTLLNRTERRRNVAKAFAPNPTAHISPNIRYVIIDDVLTTGATLHACATALYKAGALHIDAATLAHG